MKLTYRKFIHTPAAKLSC